MVGEARIALVEPCSSTGSEKSTIDQQRNRPSGPNFVLVAIILWNTVYLDHTTTTEDPAHDPLLPHLSLLGWEHISLLGDYLWTRGSRSQYGLRVISAVE
ncbi:hypothetical protein D6T64_02865 [Cryobacterium melibiosiphilum]|uniref:Tn3 transposase DDE domain-containing protein n=1 Tax=Cryobacterium melibiosiphilum TaxID=995039 RepID=A0A3A5MUU1_9MICO|nr:hypothetical protein D6T64_02865 [Cryobacterium melibiosiphilum]